MTITAKAAYKYYNTLANSSTGKPLGGYYVQVFYNSDYSIAPRYSDDTATTEIGTYTTTNSNGYFDFYLKPDYYNIRFYATYSDYVGNINYSLELTGIVHDGFTDNAAVFLS